jgi:putative sigma-54 modulation protein
MRFEFTGRHIEVTPALRAHVEEQFKKLDHIFNGTNARAHVIMEVQKSRQIGEVVVNWRDHTLTAKDANSDMYLALTRAITKLEKQALKLKKKVITRKKHTTKRIASIAPTPGGEVSPSPNGPRIVNARRYTVKPMTPEEAAMRLMDQQDQFLVFRDSETNSIGVIYKRKDGNFGLIEP